MFFRFISICHPHLHLHPQTGYYSALGVVLLSLATITVNFFEFESNVRMFLVAYKAYVTKDMDIFAICGFKKNTPLNMIEV